MGMAISQESTIQYFNNVKAPYSVNKLTASIGAVAFFVSSGFIVYAAVVGLNEIFQKLDKDGDGLVTLDEFLELKDEAFAMSPLPETRDALLAREKVPPEEAAVMQARGGVPFCVLQELAGSRLEEVVSN